MTTDSGHSPHYSILSDRKYPVLNLIYQIAQCNDPDALVRAHKAVMWLAVQDEDHATIANGLGFFKSDSVSGRNLAHIPTRQVILSSILAPMTARLARKYRRQLPHEYSVDQPKQQDIKFQQAISADGRNLVLPHTDTGYGHHHPHRHIILRRPTDLDHVTETLCDTRHSYRDVRDVLVHARRANAAKKPKPEDIKGHLPRREPS